MQGDALVLIDLQDHFFHKPIPRLLESVEAACHEFIAAVKPILSVTFYKHGDLTSRIASILTGYAGHVPVVKYGDEGSSQIKSALNKLPSVNEVVLAGVNTCACVRGTADGLVGWGFKVIVPEHLVYCNADHPKFPNRTQSECYKFLTDNVRQEPYAFVTLLNSWKKR